MAGAMRKVGEYLGLVEQADFDDEFDEEFDAPEQATRQPATRQPAVVRPAPVAHIDERRRAEPRPERRESNASDLARIETVTPRTYNDARTVGEHYRSGVPVIMNLSEIDDDDAKRLVDFAAGLVFAVHGSINRVTAKVFLLSPENISVTDEDKQRIAAGGFFNQS
ncbi:cell division protein SepF [Aeromicrobium stalagmiti]|uniref:cell division protein SepF n=1 Tax=Aeromicrobium stalagmiti TaxID=2738988 RepID=UPI00156983E1|nr:cell division protein SepF [Aeromicrobium stalagmiti]NRQ50990.1 cell division protein SepF [Aeromicrobium stalagmiti]